jgi:hypothetical protein
MRGSPHLRAAVTSGGLLVGLAMARVLPGPGDHFESTAKRAAAQGTITGSVTLAGGQEWVFGPVGSTATVSVTFVATTTGAPVTEVRGLGYLGTRCTTEDGLGRGSQWRAFTESSAVTLTLLHGTLRYFYTAQLRDADGQTSAILCDWVNVEGEVPYPPSPTATATPTPHETPRPRFLPDARNEG